MARRRTLLCSVITPEAVVLESEATFVALPAHDGEVGVLLDRAPLVCKLGVGELRVVTLDDTRHYLLDGGFAQVLDNEVSVLTGRAVPVEQLRRDEAQKALQQALAMSVTDDASLAARQTALARARVSLRLARQ